MALDPKKPRRNPGPSWGFAFLNRADDLLPRSVFDAVLAVGTAVALPMMSDRRRHSRDYLRVALGREPNMRDLYRHFHAFAKLLIRRLRVSRGLVLKVDIAPGADAEAIQFLKTTHQALFGSFHFGHSDLLGFLLTDSGRKVAMVRTRMGNSPDTDSLAKTFSSRVNFVWVNDPSMALFAIKEAIDLGQSVAMQCDRVEFSSRLEPFQFLGARRHFPFTIYHLSLLFGLPVIFCFGMATKGGGTIVYSSPVFRAVGTKALDLPAARAHFQAVLVQLESLLGQDPYLWFNFLPLNPVVTQASSA